MSQNIRNFFKSDFLNIQIGQFRAKRKERLYKTAGR